MSQARLLAPLLLALGAAPASADADLTMIDRTIARQPAYQSGSPRYCLLVFGPEAATRVWLVLDGDRLFIDRNGDGDLTGDGESVPVKKDRQDQSASIEAGPITARAGVAPNTRVELLWSDKAVRIYCSADGKPAQRAGSDGAGDLRFGDSPQAAPVVHFHGALTLYPDEPYTFKRGEDPTEFYAFLGTRGLGAGSFACISYQDVPRNVHPVAEITFPAASAGSAPVVRRVVLDRRC
jgi:hypothetical protein